MQESTGPKDSTKSKSGKKARFNNPSPRSSPAPGSSPHAGAGAGVGVSGGTGPVGTARLERRVSKHPDSRLIQYAKDYTSQGGEDGIIEHIFKSILPPTQGRNSYCVDVGAWDGKHLSNTFTLLNRDKWSGMLVEADPARNTELRKLYEGREDVHCIDAFVELTGANTLVKYLVDYAIPTDFEFLSIDIDGADYYVWKSLHSQFYPKIVCIEFNPTISNRIVFVQEPDSRVHQGSSLLAMVELGKEMGYKLLVTTQFNAFFVRDDMFRHFDGIVQSNENLDLDRLNPCSMVTEMFQTYEGELKFVGPLKLLWHRLALNPQKLQVLSKKQRYFPFSPLCGDSIGQSSSSSNSKKDGGNSYRTLTADQYAVITEMRTVLNSFTCNRTCDCTRDFFMDAHFDDDDDPPSRDSIDSFTAEMTELLLGPGNTMTSSDSIANLKVRTNLVDENDEEDDEDDDDDDAVAKSVSTVDSHRLSSKHICSNCADTIKRHWHLFIDACERVFVVASMQGLCLDAISMCLLHFAIKNRFCGPNINENPLFEYAVLINSSSRTDMRFVSKIEILKYLLFTASQFVRARGESIMSSQAEEAMELLRVADSVFWLSCQAMIRKGNTDNNMADADNPCGITYNKLLEAAIYDSGANCPPADEASTDDVLSTPVSRLTQVFHGSTPLRNVVNQECSPLAAVAISPGSTSLSTSSSFSPRQQLSYTDEEKRTFVQYCLQFGRLCRIRGSLLECWCWLTKASLYLSSLNSYRGEQPSDHKDDHSGTAGDVDLIMCEESIEVSKEWKKLFVLTSKLHSEMIALYPGNISPSNSATTTSLQRTGSALQNPTVFGASVADNRNILEDTVVAPAVETPRPSRQPDVQQNPGFRDSVSVAAGSERVTPNTNTASSAFSFTRADSNSRHAASVAPLPTQSHPPSSTEESSNPGPASQSLHIQSQQRLHQDVQTERITDHDKMIKPRSHAEKFYHSMKFTSVGLVLGVAIGYGLSAWRSK
jgi:hypothetical protein